MNVVPSKIKRYKVIQWFDEKAKEIIYGIDVVLNNGSVFHYTDTDSYLFFKEKKEANKKARQLNKDLK